MGKTYAYARVSTAQQNEDRQIIALTEFGVEKKTSTLISSLARISTGRNIRN